jgi:hypothetical protein
MNKAILYTDDAINEYPILKDFYYSSQTLTTLIRYGVIKGILRKKSGAIIDRESLKNFVEFLKKQNNIAG